MSLLRRVRRRSLRAQRYVVGVLVVVLAFAGLSFKVATGQGPRIEVPAGVGTQPGSLVYGDPSEADAYGAPGGLVVAGRTNYDDPVFRRVSARGGSVLLYLDPLVDNPYGRYHTMMFERSACGAAVPRWPGSPRANEWGFLSDFRPGSVLQGKLRCVLETMVRENPHIAGWFVDDVGSRSWFPGIDWATWGHTNQVAYREGAVALSRTFRQVASAHGLIFLVNGTWSAGALFSDGGGYPDPGKNGNALADGAVVENHDGESAYFAPYACSRQWAAQSSVTRGRAVNFAVTRTWAGLQEYVSSGCFAYANRHSDYTFAAPWSGFHDLGLLRRQGSTGTGG